MLESEDASWRVAIGDEVREFPPATWLSDTWAFLHERLAEQDEPIAVVLEDHYGYRVGEIWESSLFYALAETKHKLAAYLRLSGFAEEPEG